MRRPLLVDDALLRARTGLHGHDWRRRLSDTRSRSARRSDPRPRPMPSARRGTMWAPQRVALEAHYRVVLRRSPRTWWRRLSRSDRTASTNSAATSIALTGPARDTARASMCGLSLGGMVALWLGAHAHGTGRSPGHRRCVWPGRHRRGLDRPRASGARRRHPGGVGPGRRAMGLRRQGSEGRRAMVRGMLAGYGAGRLRWCCEAIAGMDLRPALPK